MEERRPLPREGTGMPPWTQNTWKCKSGRRREGEREREREREWCGDRYRVCNTILQQQKGTGDRYTGKGSHTCTSIYRIYWSISHTPKTYYIKFDIHIIC